MLAPAIRNCSLIALACLMTYCAGKDANWDLLNYHFYIAHAWTHDKYLVDFMGAGPNSYFNPLGYLPFYWMVMAGWHSLTIGLLLGAFHGISLIVLWNISERLLFKGLPQAHWLTLLSVLLAASSPVFAGTVGGTFLEPTLTVLVLCSLLITALGCERSGFTNSTLLILAGGLLIGLATGLKLTNIVFLAAMGLSLLSIIGLRWRGLFITMTFLIGVIVGYLLANGWWANHLYQEFGNPFFPFFNEIFQSPDFSTAKLDHDRFKPNSLWDVLVLPFRMADFHSWIYIENNAPDIRPALLVFFSFAFATRLLLSRTRAIHDPQKSSNVGRRIIFAFFIYSVAFWLWTTGNGRYALPILILLGPLLTWLIFMVMGNAKKAIALASFVLILQVFHAWSAGNPRWAYAEWTPHWFEVAVPPRLKDNPYAYLSMGTARSNSVIAPFFHPQSTYLSLMGGTYSFQPDGPGSKRIRQFISDNENRLRMLITIPSGREKPTSESFNYWDSLLAPWSLKINRSDCEFVDMTLDQDKALASPASSGIPSQFKSSNDNRIPMLTCALQQGTGENEETRLERRRVTAVFDRIEEFCPLLFSPRGWHLTRSTSGWHRTYLQSDIVVYAIKGRLTLSKREFGPFDVDMGTIEDWEHGRSKFVCQRLAKPW